MPPDIPATGKVIKPQEGFQMNFASSTVDVVFGGGILASGKSYGLVLAMAEPLMTDPDFRGLITRRSLQNQKAGGGFVDTFQSIFGEYCSVKVADSPRISFDSGAYCDLTYIDDTNLDKFRERAKGMQYDCICIDEITEMSWEVFTYIQTRNRGRSKTFTGKFFATMNPKRSHWVRQFIDWYIGADGYIRDDRDGKVRYFYINGSTVNDVVWGNSKEEVYEKCRIDIDRKIRRVGGNTTYKNMIKSFVFYQGRLSENKGLLDENPNYVGSVAASGGKMAQALFEGNWNVDPDEDEKIPMPSDKVRECFINDPKRNGDKWITVDLAGEGSDNLVALLWDGFHCYDKLVKSETTPQGNAVLVRQFAAENEVATSHIIFDAINGAYFNDYIPDAVPYKSSKKPFGLYKDAALTIKDMCYLRLCQMVRDGNLSFDEKLANSYYRHKNLAPVTMQNEIMEEFSVIRFDEQANGKKKLWAKKKMNQMLGKHRSMDVADPCAMRMLPCAKMEYGAEVDNETEERNAKTTYEAVAEYAQPRSIFDETFWC